MFQKVSIYRCALPFCLWVLCSCDSSGQLVVVRTLASPARVIFPRKYHILCTECRHAILCDDNDACDFESFFLFSTMKVLLQHVAWSMSTCHGVDRKPCRPLAGTAKHPCWLCLMSYLPLVEGHFLPGRCFRAVARGCSRTGSVLCRASRAQLRWEAAKECTTQYCCILVFRDSFMATAH
jgi:hypothetical protein